MHLIPDLFAGTVSHFGVDSFFRLWKAKAKAEHDFIEFCILFNISTKYIHVVFGGFIENSVTVCL